MNRRLLAKANYAGKPKPWEGGKPPARRGMRQNVCPTMMEGAGMKKFFMVVALLLAIPASWGKTFLIDVRTPEEFSAGHIEGAINIEYQGIEQKIAQSGAARNDEVILYCHSGRRAGIARDSLLKAGFVNVQNYGGMEEARQRLITRPHTQP
jgi:phage shock protein E